MTGSMMNRAVGRVLLQKICDSLYGGDIGEHPNLDGADVKIVKDSLQLLANDRRRHHVHRAYAMRVLCRNGRDDTCAVDVVVGKCFEISLYAGAAAGI